jgi:hypothetical protein
MPLTAQEQREFLAAQELIGSLKVGDRVRVQRAGEKAYEMYVSRGPTRSDGPFGSPESLHVTVTFGPGRYATEVGIDDLWRRRRGHGYIGGGTTLEKIEDTPTRADLADQVYQDSYEGGYGSEEFREEIRKSEGLPEDQEETLKELDVIFSHLADDHGEEPE